MKRSQDTATRLTDIGIPCLLICGALLAGTAGCSQAPETHGTLVATYRDGVVTAADYDLWLDARKLSQPPEDPRAEIEQLVIVRALAESAVAQGLDRQPGLAFQLQLIEDRTLETAFNRRLAESVAFSKDEIDSLLAANPGAFSKPRRARLYNIFKHFPPDATDEDRRRIRRRMEEIHDELVAGSDFEEMALTESDSETRYRSGRMGVIAQGELPPAIDAIVMNMAEGEISRILESAEGLTILKCSRVFDAERASPEEMRSKTETNLLRIRRRDNQQQMTEDSLDSSGLEIDMVRALDPSIADDEVIGRFGAHALTRSQLDLIVAARRPPNRRSAPLNQKVVRESIEMYVVTVLTAQRARELELDNDELLSGIHVQQQRALATEDMRHQVESRLVEPTPSEMEAYLETHQGEFQHPMEVDLMMIGFSLTEGLAQTVHADARTALDAIDSGDLSFEQATRRYSAPDTTDSPMVSLTSRQLAGYGGAVGNAVRGLAPGQVSRIIRQDDRLWIVKLVDRRQPRPLAFDEAKDRIRRRLGQDRVDMLTSEIEAAVINEQQITLVGDDG